MQMTEAHKALFDANTCIELHPGWLKGYYRKGVALMFLKVKQITLYCTSFFTLHLYVTSHL
jgi:hypothetical protein